MLAAHQISFSRAGHPVFGGLDIALEAGEALQVLGANGSGKSTLLRVLGGLLEPDEGTVCWHGRPVREDATGFHEALRYLGHANGLDADMTADENLRFSLRLAGHGPIADPAVRDIVHDALARADLLHAAHLPVRTLSQGQRRRVALARLALLPGPLWLLDEPHAALDGEATARFDAALAEHLDGGGVAVIATHQPIAGMRGLRALHLVSP